MRTKSASKTITRDPRWLAPAIAPGEILVEEYLKPLGLSQLETARRLGVSLNRLNEIIRGKRGITADTALRLGKLLKTSPQLWMRLQADWDLHRALERAARKRVITPCRYQGFIAMRPRAARQDRRAAGGAGWRVIGYM